MGRQDNKKRRGISLFTGIAVPVLIVIILQIVWICGLLWSNGTISTLTQNALNIMDKSTENAGSNLSTQMLERWSQIGSLTDDVNIIIGDYLTAHDMSIDEFMNGNEDMSTVEEELAGTMLGMLRFSGSTGIYIIFTNNEEELLIDNGRAFTLEGLHFRDLDPANTPSDYSDILMIRGKEQYGAAYGVETDSLWQEHVAFNTSAPENFDNYSMYLNPLFAAREAMNSASGANDFDPLDFAYWGRPRVLSTVAGTDTRDTNRFITYSLPIIYDGKVIGVIGTEMQVSQIIDRFLIESDFENIGGGYMLGFYTNDTGDGSEITFTPRIIVGEKISGIFAQNEPTIIERDVFTHDHMVSDNIYVYNREKQYGDDSVHMSIYDLNLYDSTSPFYSDHWAVVGAAPDTELFATADTIWRGIIVSAVFCLVLSVALTGIVVAVAVRPLRKITEEIKDNAFVNPADYPPLSPQPHEVREITILRETLNTLRERQIADGEKLSEERERYRLALSLAEGTVMEYDPLTDIVTVSRFETDNNAEPRVTVIDHVLSRARDGEITHPEDKESFIGLFSGRRNSAVIRIRQMILSKESMAENEYYWIRFNCKVIRDVSGNFLRLLGTTQNVTAAELRRQLEILNNRTDPTTHLYNAEYGKILCESALAFSHRAGKCSLLALIQLEPALLCETYYGLFYTNILHAFVAKRISRLISEDDILVRAGDNEILLFMTSGERDERILQAINDLAADTYVGENEEIKLTISAGFAVSEPGMDLYELTGRAYAALRAAVEQKIGGHMDFADLPPESRKVITYMPTPISFFTDVMAMRVTAIAFNLFERTTDTASVINMLARVAAYRFRLSRVFIVENDLAFLANNVTFCFTHNPNDTIKRSIVRAPGAYYEQVDARLKSTGYCTVTSSENPSESIITLLRLEDVPEYSVLVCGMYSNGELTGKIVFVRPESNYVWSEEATEDLNAVTKIITSHLVRAKSDTASKAKTEFLSKISHEIRTPMNAIIGLSEIAAKSYSDDNHARVSDCLSKIDSSAKFLLAIINDVLDMSKIESGAVELESKPFELNTAVANISNMIRPLIENKGMDFIVETDIKTPRVIGDEARLKQVLTNLLGNAVKFTNAGYIKFTAAEHTENNVNFYTFAVSDTGIGISKEDIERIFGSYVQLSSSDKVYGGTGLGLSISAQIVRLMGGKIAVDSTMGHGSTFRFTIPLPTDETPEVSAAESAEDTDYTDRFRGRHVLLVEDNELNTEIAIAVLEDAGFEVTAAENGQIGADEYDKQPDGYFDAILMDIRMPVLDGLGATRLIRTNKNHPDARTVPIIAMTANAFDEDMKKSLEAGMSGYLPKPIDTLKLYHLLDEVIKNKSDDGFVQ